jgi:hypothetical protein
VKPLSNTLYPILLTSHISYILYPISYTLYPTSYILYPIQTSKQVGLNRKVLADLAVTEPLSFKSVVEVAKLFREVKA